MEIEHVIRPYVNRILGANSALTQLFNAATHSTEGAQPSQGKAFPVIVFSHGAFSYLQSHTYLMEALASFGYVVISIGHPGLAIATVEASGRVKQLEDRYLSAMRTAAESTDFFTFLLDDDPNVRYRETISMLSGRFPLLDQFHQWMNDFIGVLDCLFEARIPDRARALLKVMDLSRVATVGMSFGAAAAVAAHVDTRISATVVLDGAVWDEVLLDSDIRTPALVLHSDLSLSIPTKRAYPHSAFFFDRNRTAGLRQEVQRVELRGASHQDFTDLCLADRSVRHDFDELDRHLGPIEGDRMATITSEIVAHFLGLHLGVELEDSAIGRITAYPEAQELDLADVRQWAEDRAEV